MYLPRVTLEWCDWERALWSDAFGNQKKIKKKEKKKRKKRDYGGGREEREDEREKNVVRGYSRMGYREVD